MQPIVKGNSPWDLGFQLSIPAAPLAPEIPWKTAGKATSWQVWLWNVNFFGTSLCKSCGAAEAALLAEGGTGTIPSQLLSGPA